MFIKKSISERLTIVVVLITALSCNKGNPVDNSGAGTVSDMSGNVYSTVKIGNQVWTVENLRTIKYADGTPIPHVTDASAWKLDTTGAYCFYDNTTNSDSINRFGALYNWYAVHTGKLAPAGWHVPDTADWNVLQHYLIANGYRWDGATDSEQIAKSLAATTDWAPDPQQYPGAIGTNLTKNNRSGFSALPGGYCNMGYFYNHSDYGFWWSTTEHDTANAYEWYLGSTGAFFSSQAFYKNAGLSIRLVRD
jgi:uncharacterized protein (TIGR02145 family)